ncbi:MAG: hypothetical protein ABH919_04185 [bacterium]
MIKINRRLFWDVKFSELDYIKNADFIISRVLSYGDVVDYKEIKKRYGLRKIKNTARKITYANKKSLYFWSFIFNLPLNSFKCTKKLLTKKQSVFWQR